MEQLLENFSLDLFVKQTILFLLLIFLMVKFAWKPIMSALNEREEGIQGALDAAENAKKEMASLQADNEKLLKEARAEREAMLKEAREMKTKMIDDAKVEAKDAADKMVAQAQAAIEAERKSAIADLKGQVAALSVEIAEKVVKNELSDKEKQLGLVDKMLGQATLN
ncbi:MULTISPECIES: F0F1 ATP synthase subunit B [Dokdonia]|jgi:F-type H+-transporting ATPase subunit b|uniref:ATP synthase subunit b n=1 Tax=Dokdonia donghaensis DSW-1 TaxID=1300343 RepID=A0A0A2GXB3_9FLAO|nr:MULTISPECIES: F0F1 ATP synthase subunit B [Dokdonia]ANH59604.1 ATP synthase subunit b [Dokdonia donghaensis DSW-1]AOE06029.1 ATP synthase F0 subunit B [uncultured bacterium]EAQ39725.1 ATP synthase, B subunit [Dokdonia sp. MED134]KGO06966.1 ATP F0F1 synthase subunit B [Dokdonia donghaensis DSW-1]